MTGISILDLPVFLWRLSLGEEGGASRRDG